MADSRSEGNAHDGTSVVPESGEDNKITGVILKVFKNQLEEAPTGQRLEN